MTSRRRRVPREVRSRPVGRILFVGLRRVEDQKREGRVLRRNTQSREDQLEPSAAMRDLGPRRPTGRRDGRPRSRADALRRRRQTVCDDEALVVIRARCAEKLEV